MSKFSNVDHSRRMAEAIAIARSHQTPYGCLLLDTGNGETIAKANTTRKDGKTAHAEMNALRAMHQLQWEDPGRVILYTTGEPCPMCMGAIIWCGIKNISYGLSIQDIEKYHKQIKISSDTVARHSWLEVNISGGLERDACLHLFATLVKKPNTI